MKKFVQKLMIRLGYFLSLLIAVWMIVTKETEYFLVIIALLIILDFLKESKRPILMRSDTKLPQPFASWSNSL